VEGVRRWSAHPVAKVRAVCPLHLFAHLPWDPMSGQAVRARVLAEARKREAENEERKRKAEAEAAAEAEANERLKRELKVGLT
jgi:hypothetical protein